MQHLIGMLREGAIHTTAADGRGAMVDARDAAVTVDALTSRGCDGKTCTPTGPQAVSFDEVAEILSRETGKRIRHVRVAPDDVRNALERSGVEAWFAEDVAKLHSMLAAGYEDLSPTTFARSWAPHRARLPSSAGLSPPASRDSTQAAEASEARAPSRSASGAATPARDPTPS